MPGSPEANARAHRSNLDLAVVTLNALKVNSGCVDCGYRAHPAALHFDHIDPRTKLRELGWQHDRSKLTSKAKLARYIEHVTRYCEIRCANCHAVRTAREKHWETTQSKRKAEPTLF